MHPRSVQQIKTYYRLCQLVVDNTENPDFNTKNKVDLQLRVKLGWCNEPFVINNRVQFNPKSISFKEMRHLEACRYFERAFETISKFLDVPLEELIDRTKRTR